MQQTEYMIETDGAKITALDADGNGQFIALTEAGDVIAHDFRIRFDPKREERTLAIKYPKIRRLDRDRFIIIAARTWDGYYINAQVFDTNGKRMNFFHIGDGVSDMMICNDKIVATYTDEGVYGDDGPNKSGLSVFSFAGECLYGYNDDKYGNDNSSANPIIRDCYAACRIDSERVAFYSYDSYRLSCFDVKNYTSTSQATPRNMNGPVTSLTVKGNINIVRVHGYERGGLIYWWENGANEAEFVPEGLKERVRGLENGRFLAQSEYGYTIIDPLALSVKETLKIGTRRLELVLDDITNQQVDAIVNAANSQLAGGFGVDGAIHRRGGPAIMEETRENYPIGCPTGSAVPSNAGKLDAKYVFHAVGPRWFDDPERFDLLRSAYQKCLELGVELHCRSIAFPSISTGDFGFPLEKSAAVAIETVCEFLRSLPTESPLEFVRFCLFSEKDLETYRAAVKSCGKRFGGVE